MEELSINDEHDQCFDFAQVHYVWACKAGENMSMY